MILGIKYPPPQYEQGSVVGLSFLMFDWTAGKCYHCGYAVMSKLKDVMLTKTVVCAFFIYKNYH